MKSRKPIKRRRASRAELGKFRKVRNKSNIIAKFFKVLGHKSRLEVLCRLCKEPSTVTELTRHLDLEQTTVSQILSRLESAGLVKYERYDTRSLYEPYNDEVKDTMNEMLEMLLKADETLVRKRKGKLFR